MKFKNPGGYLNNVYREHLEEKYGSDFLGMNPASMWEIGGRELPGAKYMYKVGEYTVVLLKLLDIRDAGDVEYTVKYVDGEDASVMAAVNEAVRTYRETDVPDRTGGRRSGTMWRKEPAIRSLCHRTISMMSALPSGKT